MEPIRSGSTTERIVRTSLVTAFVAFFAGYCFYDGLISWPRQNLQKALKEVKPKPVEEPRIIPNLNSETVGQIESGIDFTKLVAKWGERRYEFDLPTDLAAALDEKSITDGLKAQFSEHEAALSQYAAVDVVEPGARWKVTDFKQAYEIARENGTLKVYRMVPGWKGPIKTAARDEPTKPDHYFEARFFGRAGQIVAVVNAHNHQIATAQYVESEHKDESSLFTQIYVMGIPITVVAVLLLIWLIGWVLLPKAELTDEGLKVRGHPRVPFEAMQTMRTDNFERKGWVEIDYKLDGQEGTLKLNDYHIKAFPQMMAEICKRKGWDDPVKAWEAKKAARKGKTS